MRTFRVPISRRIRGFTLVELIVVVFLLSILLTFASVNWSGTTKKGRDALKEHFSIDVAMIREEAVENYENRVVEFDLATGAVRVGWIDQKTGFTPIRDLRLQEGYEVREAIINGERFSQGKCSMTFYAGGMVDRAVLHFEGGQERYSLLVNPLTARVTDENGYVEEVSVPQGGNNPP